MSELTAQTGDLAEVRDLLRRAERGDETALPRVRELLRDPEAVDLLGGDMARRAQRDLIRALTGNNLLAREAIGLKLEALRAELCGPNPTPVERLLVERVVSCWLHLHQLEVRHAQRADLSVAVAGYYQAAITAAHNRYLSAVRALTAVRKLAVPVLQVNIAREQVNVAAGSPTSGSAR